MKWVKENIASFGGDPQSITIYGWSAGAVGVSAHTLSSGSWPYFDRAIMQSGTLMAQWGLATSKKVQELFSLFLDAVNCTNNVELLDCLQNNVTEEDLKYIYDENSKSLVSRTFFVPHIDGDFLTNLPELLVENGELNSHHNVMMGITKDENFMLSQHLLHKDLDLLSQTFHNVVETSATGFHILIILTTKPLVFLSRLHH